VNTSNLDVEVEMRKMKKYFVDVVGHSRKRFEAIDQAIDYAALQIYIAPDAKNAARNLLAAGRIAE